MQNKKQKSWTQGVLYLLVMLGVVFSLFGKGPVGVVRAQDEITEAPATEVVTETPTEEPTTEATATPTPTTATETPTAEATVTPTPTATAEAATSTPTLEPTATPQPDVEGQIVGGTLADLGEYPWQVYLSIIQDGKYYQCGGSLVDTNWVLTAAHCITTKSGSVTNSVTTYAGMYDSSYYGVYRTSLTAKRVIRHPAYSNSTLSNDIALIELNGDMPLGDGPAPYQAETRTAVIPLVPANVGNLAGKSMRITGWGDTYSGGSGSDELREVQLPILSNAVCNDYWHWNGQITSNMLCAGYDPGGDKSTCQGDSGGPGIVWNSSTGQWNLAGVVSFGPEGCNKPYLPSVLTRVSAYGSWINGYILDPAVLTYPVNTNIGTNYNPTYTWNKANNVTRYRLYVKETAGKLVLDRWYEAASVCNTSTCSVTPGPEATLIGGAYQWYVQTYNDAGSGPWSNTDANGVVQSANFTATVPVAPGAAVLTYPAQGQTLIDDFTPKYTWNRVATALWYRVYIGGPGGKKVYDQWHQASQICDATVCSINPNVTLGVGTYAWYVQTYNNAGYGPWNNTDAKGVALPTNFTTVAATLPAAATLVSPINDADIGLNYNPVYTWNKIANATWYRFYLGGPGGAKVLDQWFQATQICNDTTCSVTGPTLTGGQYKWYVQTWNPAGYGPWSNTVGSVINPALFHTITTPPVATTLTYPAQGQNIGADFTPKYTWDKVANAEWYRVYVAAPNGKAVYDKWHRAAEVCDAATCSIVPNVTLVIGTHAWYVQTWNSAGYGPWSNAMQPTNFTTAVAAVPGMAALTYPAQGQNIGANYYPTYTWNKVVNATWYRLYVSGPTGAVVLDQWYQASSVCDATTCSVLSPVLAGGAHKWYVQTWNPKGYGPWSNTDAKGVAQPTIFTTAAQTVPPAATLTAPTGTITNQTPAYAWDRTSMATWYRVYVKGANGVILDKWYQASAICNATTCSVPSPKLDYGAYVWWIQSYNPAGYSPWQSMNFTVSP